MSAPTAAFLRAADRVGGEQIYSLYTLAVTAPVARTWVLGKASHVADALYSGSPAVHGIVHEIGPVMWEVSVGGESSASTITLVLEDHVGTAPDWPVADGTHRFSDWFVLPVPGYAEPYDLDSATLTVSIVVAGLTSGDVLVLGKFRTIPGRKSRVNDQLSVTFEADFPIRRPLPRRRLNTQQWPSLPASSNGLPIPVVFGSSVTVPGIPVVPVNTIALGTQNGEFVFCESPAATPVTPISLVALLQNPNTQLLQQYTVVNPTNPYLEHDGSTNVGARILADTVGATDSIRIAAAPIVPPETVFFNTIELRLGGGPGLSGRILVRIETSKFDTVWNAGVNITSEVPSGELVHPNAEASILEDSVAFSNAWYTLSFTDPFPVRAQQHCWIVVTWVPVTTPLVNDTNSVSWEEVNLVGSWPFSETMYKDSSGALRTWISETSGGTARSFNYRINGIVYTLNAAKTDGTGRNVLHVDLNFDPDVPIGALLDGIKDDVSGTYTGTASSLIVNFSDIGRFLGLEPAIGLELVAGTSLDLEMFVAARQLVSEVQPAQGAVTEAAAAQLWLARLGRAGRLAFYTTQDGMLGVRALQSGGAIVRRVRTWEHGTLDMRTIGGETAGGTPLPFTAVELYAGQDLMEADNPSRSRSSVSGWDAYVVISKDVTAPADAVRQAQATALETRYGFRSNSGLEELDFFTRPVGASVSPRAVSPVTEATAGYFISTAGSDNARDYLFDIASRRPFLFDLIIVELPRYALGWRLFDVVQVESYDFPWGGRRTVPTETAWDVTWADDAMASESWYACRVGTFSVRRLVIDPESQGRFPVQATLQLMEWSP